MDLDDDDSVVSVALVERDEELVASAPQTPTEADGPEAPSDVEGPEEA
jgi:hypothetical protein